MAMLLQQHAKMILGQRTDLKLQRRETNSSRAWGMHSPAQRQPPRVTSHVAPRAACQLTAKQPSRHVTVFVIHRKVFVKRKSDSFTCWITGTQIYWNCRESQTKTWAPGLRRPSDLRPYCYIRLVLASSRRDHTIIYTRHEIIKMLKMFFFFLCFFCVLLVCTKLYSEIVM